MIAYRAVRYYFDTIEAAALALVTVLEDARSTARLYEFGSLSPEQVFASGLHVAGDIEDVLPKIDSIPGVTRYDE